MMCTAMFSVIVVCMVLRITHALAIVQSPHMDCSQAFKWMCSCCRRDGARHLHPRAKQMAQVALLHIFSVLEIVVQTINAMNLMTVNVNNPHGNEDSHGEFGHVTLNCIFGLMAIGLLYVWLLLREKTLRDGSMGMIPLSGVIKASYGLVAVQWLIILLDYIFIITGNTPFCQKKEQFGNSGLSFFEELSFYGLLLFGMVEAPINAFVLYAFLNHFKRIQSPAVRDVVRRSTISGIMYLVSWLGFWGWWLGISTNGWMTACQWSANMCAIGRILSTANFMTASLGICISHRDDITLRRAISSLCMACSSGSGTENQEEDQEHQEEEEEEDEVVTPKSSSISYESETYRSSSGNSFTSYRDRAAEVLDIVADHLNANMHAEIAVQTAPGQTSMPSPTAPQEPTAQAVTTHNPITERGAEARPSITRTTNRERRATSTIVNSVV